MICDNCKNTFNPYISIIKVEFREQMKYIFCSLTCTTKYYEKNKK